MRNLKLPFLIILLFAISGFTLLAQTPQEVLETAFPLIKKDLKIDEQTKYDKLKKNDYRELYVKLGDATEEIKRFKIVGNESEILTIFELKDLKSLKKDEKLDELTQLIHKQRLAIHNLMFGNEKYGADSVRCIRNLSMFQQFIKQKNYNDAYKSWTILFKEFPKAASSIYSKGDNVVVYKLSKAKTKEEQQAWIDTLLMTFDQRIKYYGDSKKYDKGYILGRKGVAMLKYRQSQVEEAYNTLMQSIDLRQVNSEDVVILTTMQATMGMYEKEKIDAAKVVDVYFKLSDILAKRLGLVSEKQKKRVNTATQGVDALFMNSDAAKCEVLVEAFDSRFKESPDDVDLVKKIVRVLDKKGCTDTELYENAAVALYPLEPSELAAYNLAKLKAKKGKNKEAIEYFDKAIEMAEVDTMKAIYSYEAAKIYKELNQYSKARSYSYKATELNPNFGTPYVLVATLYAATANQCGNAFESSCVFWLVVDKLVKAKSVDPSLEEQVNGLINSYARNYPNKEEAFMHSVKSGDPIKIGCWIQESTTARF